MEQDLKDIGKAETEFSPMIQGVLFLLFIGCSFLVFNVGGYNSFIASDMILLVRLSVVGVLLIPTFILYRTAGRWNRYWKLSFSFLISSIGLLLAWLFGRWLVEKDFTSLYLRGGDLRKSLKLGLLASFAALLPFILVGGLGLTATPAMILSWMPWMCAFAVSNAFMEELMIRGVFLRKYTSIFGERQSLLLTTVIFTVFHQAIVGYTDFVSFSVFMVMIFFLGLIWGYVIQKSDNIWGSVLAHTVADILFMLAVFGV